MWVLKYGGEGHFTVMLANGAVILEDLGFSTGPMERRGDRCHISPACWGVLAERTVTTYWTFLRTEDGRQGWPHQSTAFLVPD